MPENQVFEIEIKSLLGDQENADRLLEKMRVLDPGLKLSGSHNESSSYFIGGNLKTLAEKVSSLLSSEDAERFRSLSGSENYSLRTKIADGQVLLVLKISRDSATSVHSTDRIEFEAPVSLKTIDELDRVILETGFRCQSKWSRERSVYQFRDTKVTIDKNAGYGYLAEFEIIETDPLNIDVSKERLKKIMSDLGVEELDQARLERMFKFYNAHWQDYYGTDKVFTVE